MRIAVVTLITCTLLVFCACSSRQYVSGVSTDSTLRVGHSYIELLRDTNIAIRVPEQQLQRVIILQPCVRRSDSVVHQLVQVPDTTSELRTAVAISTVAIHSGILTHTLSNLDTTLTAVAVIKDSKTVSDSTATTTTTTTVVEIQYRQHWWQTTLMWLGVAALAIAILYVVIAKRFYN